MYSLGVEGDFQILGASWDLCRLRLLRGPCILLPRLSDSDLLVCPSPTKHPCPLQDLVNLNLEALSRLNRNYGPQSQLQWPS